MATKAQIKLIGKKLFRFKASRQEFDAWAKDGLSVAHASKIIDSIAGWRTDDYGRDMKVTKIFDVAVDQLITLGCPVKSDCG